MMCTVTQVLINLAVKFNYWLKCIIIGSSAKHYIFSVLLHRQLLYVRLHSSLD